jgi:tetratricopeptide (TPR) repeat protein
MIRLFSLSVFFLVVFRANSCINTYLTRLDGTSTLTQSNGTIRFHPKKRDASYWKNKSDELLKDYRRTDSIEYYSDYGVALIMLGEYQKAKTVFLRIEKKIPNLYQTASNLGTLYELAGKADSALYWIKKSVRINPNSHEGSEWIHIRILEFKLNKHKDYHRSVLQLNFGREAKPSNPQHYDLRKLESHLSHQLQERINFIAAPDPIVANMLFDYGNIIAQEATVEHARSIYKEAERYGYTGELLAVRMEEMEDISGGNWHKTWEETIIPFIKEHFVALFISSIIGFLLFIWLVWRLVKRRKKRKANRVSK